MSYRRVSGVDYNRPGVTISSMGAKGGLGVASAVRG